MYSVMIADDEPENLAGLCSIVRWNELGFELKAAFPNGEEALKYLTDHDCDVLFTDIVMDGVSGLDLAVWVREHRPKTYVVLISAYQEFEYAQKAVEARAYRYLLKPTRMDALLETFRALKAALDADMAAPCASETHEDMSRSQSSLVHKLNEYVMAHLSENITLTVMAQALHYNPSYLSRAFKTASGEGVNEYVNRIRMSEARRLLENSDMKIYEVAHAVGYRDIRYFTRLFAAMTGEKPSSYRKRRMP